MELRHTIRLIRELDAEIDEIESSIQQIMDEIHSPITTIPGIGTRMSAMILAEVGDFSRYLTLIIKKVGNRLTMREFGHSTSLKYIN